MLAPIGVRRGLRVSGLCSTTWGGVLFFPDGSFEKSVFFENVHAIVFWGDQKSPGPLTRFGPSSLSGKATFPFRTIRTRIILAPADVGNGPQLFPPIPDAGAQIPTISGAQVRLPIGAKSGPNRDQSGPNRDQPFPGLFRTPPGYSVRGQKYRVFMFVLFRTGSGYSVRVP